MPNQLYAFEPFGSVQNVLDGKPIRIMPVGTFYRGERKLNITEADLRQIEQNTTSGLPRFRIPINENHNGVGKVGTVNAVKYMSGDDGPGLYAVDYELTEAGKKLVADKRFDAVSPEVVWSKNGATYQDPQTGRQIDNVLVGLALTDRPFFGHDNVALFSADVETMADVLATTAKRHNGFTKLRETMKAKFAELLAMMEDQNANGVPDAVEVPEPTATPPMQMSDQPARDPRADIQKGTETMTDNQSTVTSAPQTPPPAPEKMNISAEDFAAYKAETEKALKAQAETFAAQLAAAQGKAQAIERARRHDQLVVEAEKFMALPVKADELADKFQALEEASPDLFKYFHALLQTADGQLTQTDLFTQKSKATAGDSSETYEAFALKVHKEQFGGEPAKIGQAYSAAAQQRPDLFKVYNETAYAPSRKA